MSLRRPAPPPYGTVVFDCDSTLSTIEGIEALAGDRAAEIRAMTDRAMDGEVPIEAVYAARLELLRPTRGEIEAVGRRYVETLLPHARELVAALAWLDKRVAIVSGGARAAVETVAGALGVPRDDVFAVAILHGSDGSYAGFDADSPLTRSGGKLETLRRLAAGPGARDPVALVGDGATDLEAAPACARFVAFGGVTRREAVFAGADATCDRPDLAALLPLLCDEIEVAQLADAPRHRPLVEAALAHYS